MKDRNVMTWSFISLFLFLVVNTLMSMDVVHLTDRHITSGGLWQSTLTALILYLVPIVIAALDWKPSFYLLGLVIAMYSLGLFNVILTMATHSSASLLIKFLLDALSLAGLAVNVWWLVLALRLRKAERDARDRARFGK